MRNIRLLVVSGFALLSLTSACIFPHTKAYGPRSEYEQGLFAKARRDIYPDDVRKEVSRYTAETVLWTGIIMDVPTVSSSTWRMRIEHHYWDWLEDYSVQKEIAFLSPRGEGMFEFTFYTSEKFHLESFGRVGDMAIVYGRPKEVSPDGTIVLACKFSKFLRKGLYSTEYMDYGRDPNDVKWIRVRK